MIHIIILKKSKKQHFLGNPLYELTEEEFECDDNPKFVDIDTLMV